MVTSFALPKASVTAVLAGEENCNSIIGGSQRRAQADAIAARRNP